MPVFPTNEVYCNEAQKFSLRTISVLQKIAHHHLLSAASSSPFPPAPAELANVIKLPGPIKIQIDHPTRLFSSRLLVVTTSITATPPPLKKMSISLWNPLAWLCGTPILCTLAKPTSSLSRYSSNASG
jgi:hypothetical protein